MQGRSISVLVAVVKLNECQYVQQSRFVCFGKTNEYLEEQDKAVSRSNTWHNWASQTQSSFEEYFPPNSNWLRNPFDGFFEVEDLSLSDYERLINIANDSVLTAKVPTNFLFLQVFKPPQLKCIPRSWNALLAYCCHFQSFPCESAYSR